MNHCVLFSRTRHHSLCNRPTDRPTDDIKQRSANSMIRGQSTRRAFLPRRPPIYRGWIIRSALNVWPLPNYSSPLFHPLVSQATTPFFVSPMATAPLLERAQEAICVLCFTDWKEGREKVNACWIRSNAMYGFLYPGRVPKLANERNFL